jgi:hypothetical protein
MRDLARAVADSQRLGRQACCIITAEGRRESRPRNRGIEGTNRRAGGQPTVADQVVEQSRRGTVGQYQGGLGGVDDAGHPRRRTCAVDRDVHPTGLERREQARDRPRGLRGDDAHPRARRDPMRLLQPRELVGQGFEVAVG